MKPLFVIFIVLLVELILTMIAMKKKNVTLLRDVSYILVLIAYAIVLYQVDLSGYGPLFGIRSEVWSSILLFTVALVSICRIGLLIHSKGMKSENEFLSLINTYLGEQQVTVAADIDSPLNKEDAAAVIEAIEKGDLVRIELTLQKTK